MEITSTGHLPSEIWEHLFSICDLQSKNTLLKICQCFRSIIDHSQLPSIKCFCLGRAIYNINEQLKANSYGRTFIISDIPPKHPSATKFKFQELLNFCNTPELYQLFEETAIDALCDLEGEKLSKLTIAQLPSNVNFLRILDKAKNRDKGLVYLEPFSHPTLIVTDEMNKFGVEGDLLDDYAPRGEKPFRYYVVLKCTIRGERRIFWSEDGSGQVLLSIKLFFCKREGDSITFLSKGREIKLILGQLKQGNPFTYYYGYIHGKFEEVCKRQFDKVPYKSQEINIMREAYKQSFNLTTSH